MHLVARTLLIGILLFVFQVATTDRASAQYPVVVPSAAPAVVGYAAERRGLFGRRVVMRPVVATVAPAVAAPAAVVSAARPIVSVATPAVTVARPVVPAAAYYAPAAAPVSVYYPPPAVVPVIPVIGF